MKTGKLVACGLLMIAGLLTGMEAQADIPAPRPSRIKTVVKSGKGTISGAGTYQIGRTITLKATPASGYRFLHWGACCEDIDSTSSTLKYKVRVSTSIYAYFKKKPTVVTPSAADGKSALGVKLTWKKASGAVSYKIRRGKSSDYSKSVVIAHTDALSYFDDTCPEDANSKGKFYYWIMSIDSTGKAFGSKSKYNTGYPKNLARIRGSSKRKVGDSVYYQIDSNCTDMRKGSFGWRIVSGGQYATISSKGLFKAKKAGKVVIQATYRGKTMKKTITILKPPVPHCTECGLVG